MQGILLNEIDPHIIFLGYKLKKITEIGCISKLEFWNRKPIESNIVLAADGLRSNARGYVDANSCVRCASQTCWRGMTDYTLPERFQSELNEAWGLGKRVGFSQVAPGKVYWYALANSKEVNEKIVEDELGECFKEFPSFVRDIMSRTPKLSLHVDRIFDLEPTKKWHRKNVCLIGDAAHATTPNLGQGACQAVEDAFVIANCIEKNSHCAEAFAEYQRKRTDKVHFIVKTSWALGKLAHWKMPLMCWGRNALMKMTPKRLGTSRMERVLRLFP